MEIDDLRGRAYKVSRQLFLHVILANGISVTHTHGVSP